MRMVSLLRSLNLSKEDRQALCHAAAQRQPMITSIVGSRWENDHQGNASRLNRSHILNQVGHDKALELLTANALLNIQEAGWEIPEDTVERDEETQAFTSHPSFAGVYHSKPSGNHIDVVGSVGMDNTVDSLKFKRVNLDNAFRDYQVDIQEMSILLEINLTMDQMALLTRQTSGESPCAIRQLGRDLVDSPPALHKTTTREDEVRERTMELGRPLLECAKALEVFLTNTPKISTKDDYAQLQGHVQAMRDAIDALKEPMKLLMADVAGEVERATMRQLVAEMVGPAAALGVSIHELLN